MIESSSVQPFLRCLDLIRVGSDDLARPWISERFILASPVCLVFRLRRVQSIHLRSGATFIFDPKSAAGSIDETSDGKIQQCRLA